MTGPSARGRIRGAAARVGEPSCLLMAHETPEGPRVRALPSPLSVPVGPEVRAGCQNL
jgi:hypothetical protein